MMEIDLCKIPQHVAIIMDGNGRWAQKRNLNRLEGHKKGSEVAEDIVDASLDLGIKYLTLYAFSQENWKRPGEEVVGLMDLLHYFLISKKEKFIQQKVRLCAIGEIESLPVAVKEVLLSIIDATRSFDKLTLVLALSYGSRNEILRAVQKIIKSKQAAEGGAAPGMEGAKQAPIISAEDFSKFLDTKSFPDPDLLIRTSGEYRMSNFLLWQMAYTELYFTETLWPDFNKTELISAISEYQRRERRFGLTSDQLREFD